MPKPAKPAVPKRQRNEGTLMISKWIRVVGDRTFNRKLQRASGTTDPDRYRDIIKAIEFFIEEGRDDLIDDLFEKRRTPEELFYLRLTKRHKEVPHIKSAETLTTALTDWLKTARHHKTGMPLAPRTIGEYQNAIKQLGKHTQEGDTVRQLPTVMKRYRDWCLSPPLRMFPKQAVNAKNMVRAFVRDTEGKRSDLYHAIADIPTGVYKPDPVPMVTLADAVLIRDALPKVSGDIWWACCLTGFRYPSEFANTSWKIDGQTVVLASDYLGEGRTVPLLDASITPPALSESRYRVHFRRVSSRIHDKITPYIARDVYQRLIEEAIQNPYRMRQYLGRADDFAAQQGYTKSDTHYQQHEMTPALIDADRKLLLKHLAKELKKKPTITIKPADE